MDIFEIISLVISLFITYKTYKFFRKAWGDFKAQKYTTLGWNPIRSIAFAASFIFLPFMIMMSLGGIFSVSDSLFADKQDAVIVAISPSISPTQTVTYAPPFTPSVSVSPIPSITAKPSPTATKTATKSPTATKTTSSSNCDPAYPGVCIPPLSVRGDLDCGDIKYTNFKVLPPDPHRFDGDGDGWGCTG